jgi:hypothetical protein
MASQVSVESVVNINSSYQASPSREVLAPFADFFA